MVREVRAGPAVLHDPEAMDRLRRLDPTLLEPAPHTFGLTGARAMLGAVPMLARPRAALGLIRGNYAAHRAGASFAERARMAYGSGLSRHVLEPHAARCQGLPADEIGAGWGEDGWLGGLLAAGSGPAHRPVGGSARLADALRMLVRDAGATVATGAEFVQAAHEGYGEWRVALADDGGTSRRDRPPLRQRPAAGAPWRRAQGRC